MTPKEYLSRAYRLDRHIDVRIEQLTQMRALATRTTAALGGMPRSGSPDPHRLESVMARIADMEAELTGDVERLLELKQEIAAAIAAVPDPQQQLLLELRYLCFKSWNDIATVLHYSPGYVHQMHSAALRAAGAQLKI